MSNPEHYELTSEEIIKGNNQALEDLQDSEFRKKYDEGVRSQLQNEEAQLENYQACTEGVDVTAVATRLSGLNPKGLQIATKERFYSGEVMQAVACIASSLIVDLGEYSLAANERLREYMTQLKQIGAESVSGYAMVGSLGVKNGRPIAENMFVLKAPRNPKDANELIHEAMVAFYGTNDLRKGQDAVPNFAWIYGYFKCSPPLIDASSEGKKQVVAWCNSATTSPVAWVVYENIAPNKSFGEYVRSALPKAILNAYTSTMLGLREGVRRVSFTHFDAHDENILMCERRDDKFWIRYRTGGDNDNDGTYGYMEMDKAVPTFIDYGSSHIALRDAGGNEVHYGHVAGQGKSPLINYGVYRDRANPMHDAYKLLLFSLARMEAFNKPAFEALKGLLRFFNDIESPTAIIADQEPSLYALPWNEKIADLRLDDWINECRRYAVEKGYGDPVHEELPAGAVLLQCAGDCFSFTQELANVGINTRAPLPVPNTFLEFRDVYGALAYKVNSALGGAQSNLARSNASAAEDIKMRFDEVFDQAFNHETKRLSELEKNLQQFSIYHLPNVYADLLSSQMLNQIKLFVVKAAKFLDAYQRMQLSINSMEYIAQVYELKSNHPLNQLISKYSTVLHRSDKFRQSLAGAIQTDVNFLEPWRATGGKPTPQQREVAQFRDKVFRDDKYRQYRWYYNTLPGLLALI